MKRTRKNAHLKIYRSQPAYPNAADPSYFANKAVNVITAVALESCGKAAHNVAKAACCGKGHTLAAYI